MMFFNNNKINEKSGFSLVEVIIAIALIVILFAMFGTILGSAYRSNKLLNSNKSAREDVVMSMELKVGKDKADHPTGKGKIVLDFTDSKLDFSKSVINNKFTDKKLELNAEVYASENYNYDKESGNEKHIYVYRGELSPEPTT